MLSESAVDRAARRQRGVTLIELMVALAVLAILSTMAAPSFVDALTKARLRAAGGEVVAVMARARGEAVRLDRNVAVALGGSGSGWCIGARSAADPAVGALVTDAVDPCACATDASVCLVGGQQTIVSGADFSGVVLVAGGVLAETFDRRVGALTDLSGSTLTLQAGGSANDKFQLTVTVSPLGHARTCVPSGKPFVGGGIPSC